MYLKIDGIVAINASKIIYRKTYKKNSLPMTEENKGIISNMNVYITYHPTLNIS